VFAWNQPDLPFADPTEPRILPQDGRALFMLGWKAPSGKLNQQQAFPIEQLEDVLRMVAGKPDIYMAQCFFDRPRRCYANALYSPHAHVDFDVYNVPRLAKLSRDDQAAEILRYCDDAGTPRPSYLIASGRGIYGKWAQATPVERPGLGHMQAANRALQRRFKALGADPKATPINHLLRVTGSEHAGARRMVELLHLEQRDGQTITYDPAAFFKAVTPGSGAEVEQAILPMEDLRREARSHVAGRVFTREGWHGAIIEDVCRLPILRKWPGGLVPYKRRDIFGHVIATQLARIVLPSELALNIVQACRRILPADYIDRELMGHSASVLARAISREPYRYTKARLIELLEITPAEERDMGALISDAEKGRRHTAAKEAARREAGAIERAAYEARAAERRDRARALKDGGRSWAEVAARMGLPSAGAARVLATRARA
jgi:hypothetical protein